MSEHTLTAVGLVLDCADPERLAEFWQEAIGFEDLPDGATGDDLFFAEMADPEGHEFCVIARPGANA